MHTNSVHFDSSISVKKGVGSDKNRAPLRPVKHLTKQTCTMTIQIV